MIPKGLEYLTSMKSCSNKELRDSLIKKLRVMPTNGILSFSHREDIEEIVEILFDLIIEDYFEKNFNFSIKVNGNYTKVKKIKKR